ncbi:MAG: DUF4231 domain-containing protein [Crocinitomicaceae bacterium]|nr:DUF4231 domain-containing protein [Crocinitomicaceae bacterium]
MSNTPINIERKRSALDYLTGQIDVWNRTANKRKKKISVWRKRVFFLIIFGTFCGLLSQQLYITIEKIDDPHELDLHEVLAILSAISIALASYAGSQIISSELVKNQTKARATSEALKVQAYLYLLEAAPYAKKNRERVLYDRIEIIMKDVSDSTPELDEVYDNGSLKYKWKNFLTLGRLGREGKKDVWIQKFDIDMTFQEYIEERVEGQINGYYLKKAALFQKYLNRGNSWALIFGFMGVAVGAVAASAESSISMWIAFLSTGAASIGSYLASNRYEYLMLSYVSTASQLELISAKYKSMASASSLAQKRFVAETESIFAMEHNAWISESSSYVEEDDNEDEDIVDELKDNNIS